MRSADFSKLISTSSAARLRGKITPSAPLAPIVLRLARHGEQLAERLGREVDFEVDVGTLRVDESEGKEKGGKPEKTKRRLPYDPPVYDHRGSTFVVLQSVDQAEQARRVADEVGGQVVLP